MRRFLPFLLIAVAGCWAPLYDGDDFSERRPDYGDPLQRTEVEKLLKAGVSDGVIIEKAKKAGAEKLEADDIVALKQTGASDALVKDLITHERRPVERTVVYVPTTRYVYSDYWWGPSFYYSYDYGWGWPHRHRHYRRHGSRMGVGVRVGW